MIKKIFLLSFLMMALFSCSSVSEDYETAAKELCECMDQNGFEKNDAANIKMNIGVCLLDARVDVKDSQLPIEIERICPELKEGFEEFVDGLEE